MYRNFLLSNKDSVNNKRIRIEPISNATLEAYDKEKGFFTQQEKIDLCLSPFVPEVPAPPEGQFDEEAIETTSGWALITFDELGTSNPSYTIQHSALGTVIVTTGATFRGQTVSHNGSAYTIIGSPSLNNNLTLDHTQGFSAQIKEDSSNPNSPVLSGSYNYDSPISVLFSEDVHAVGLTGGFFDSISSTYIEVYDRVGNIVGRASNTQTGIETFGFSTGTEAKIAGFSFYVNSHENAGFALDNLRFK